MNFDFIGRAYSPFKQKFGIPRQPRLTEVQSSIDLLDQYNNADSVKGLSEYSHIWVVFIFHQHTEKTWSPLVRPPRLGGNETMGVFATRSSFRPNSIGMSAVKLLDVTMSKEQVSIIVEGLDVVDGTPIIDIKPYVPYSDCIPEASSTFATSSPETLDVAFSAHATQKLNQLLENNKVNQHIFVNIEQVLAQDPRPAYRKDSFDDKTYAMQLFNLDVKWRVIDKTCVVEEIIEK